MAALEGRRQDAVDHAVEALERWCNLGARFEYALAVIDASVACGPSQPWLVQHAATARGILEEVGARALIDRWDRLAPLVPVPAPGENRYVPAAQQQRRRHADTDRLFPRFDPRLRLRSGRSARRSDGRASSMG